MLLRAVKITSPGSPYSPGRLIVNEMQILDASGVDIATGGTPFYSRYDYYWDPNQAFDKSISQSSLFYGNDPTESYLGYILQSPTEVTAIKLYTDPKYASYQLHHGQVLVSLDTQNGNDGTWDLILDDVTLVEGGTWHTLVLVPRLVSRDVFHPQPIPAILNALPASLNRGFW